MAGRCRGIGWSILVACIAACGGRTLEEPGDSASPPESGRETAGGAKPQRQPSEPPSSTPNHPGIRFDQGDPLGACVAGFLASEEPDRPCNCLVEGVCFDSKPEACACICPRDSRANTCVSRQECERDSQTKVSCYAI
jgi:hypothetical protein